MSPNETDQLRSEFVSFFVDEKGVCRVPENWGSGRTVLPICRRIFDYSEPILYQKLIEWDEQFRLRPRRGPYVKVVNLALELHQLGQWEGAWALGQLHYDQFIKEEARTKERLHKGHPACGLAILARQIGSPSLSRHYALLSSAGDVYWEHKDPGLKIGGLAPTMLEQFESTHQHENWRERVRSYLQKFEQSKPIYLEALVAAHWFGTRSQHVLELGSVENAKPFTEVLLDSVEAQDKGPWTATGTRFEAAAGLLLASTPGFEVDSCRETSDEQIDLVVRY